MNPSPEFPSIRAIRSTIKLVMALGVGAMILQFVPGYDVFLDENFRVGCKPSCLPPALRHVGTLAAGNLTFILSDFAVLLIGFLPLLLPRVSTVLVWIFGSWLTFVILAITTLDLDLDPGVHQEARGVVSLLHYVELAISALMLMTLIACFVRWAKRRAATPPASLPTATAR
jgi:hypothetical protein